MDMNFVSLVLLLLMWKVIEMLGNIHFVQEQCLHIQLSSSFFTFIFRQQKEALLQLNAKTGKKPRTQQQLVFHQASPNHDTSTSVLHSRYKVIFPDCQAHPLLWCPNNAEMHFCIRSF